LPDDAPATLFVCVTCKGPDEQAGSPGLALYEALGEALRAHPEDHIALVPVECLSVCKRPCTIAFSAVGKWTYVVGDLTAADHAGDIITAALRYRASETGIVPWRERPVAIRRGVVARIPPPCFRTEEPKA
jgi:predicted metal-binding protein